MSFSNGRRRDSLISFFILIRDQLEFQQTSLMTLGTPTLFSRRIRYMNSFVLPHTLRSGDKI